jgi:hypothetical protein
MGSLTKTRTQFTHYRHEGECQKCVTASSVFSLSPSSPILVLNWIPFASFRVQLLSICWQHCSRSTPHQHRCNQLQLGRRLIGRTILYCEMHCTNQPSTQKRLMATRSHPANSPDNAFRNTCAYWRKYKYNKLFNFFYRGWVGGRRIVSPSPLPQLLLMYSAAQNCKIIVNYVVHR